VRTLPAVEDPRDEFSTRAATPASIVSSSFARRQEAGISRYS